ncbi:olfactory receptor 2T11-like [Sphaerodactylus townsendi]|uniref:olfactory receptor 2T11-like n=1 Tax=Sphaerodactylus townsendi TaxID=933632 RepID=UPI002025F9DC|nr:olfactory receptor 2T11-like [Sphaerodactylus townsendi]
MASQVHVGLRNRMELGDGDGGKGESFNCMLDSYSTLSASRLFSSDKMNRTSWTEFVFLGLFNHTTTHTIFFGVLLLTFLVALFGNCLFLLVIQTGSEFQTPMYFFLSQLSCMDVCQIFTIVPKMSMDFLKKKNVISLAGCGIQMFFTLTMGGGECLLLTVMSYDRYVAICKPLKYPVLMSRRMCVVLSAGTWIGASFHALILTLSVFHLPFCKSNVINQFFCTVPSVLKLSCSEASAYENGLFVTGVVMLLGPISIILASYISILLTVLGMQSVEGRHKAFGTCISHLIVVSVFYGAASFKYMRPRSYRTPQQDKIVSVFCDIVTPTLNPLIYSLRNRDVLAVLRKWYGKCN